MTDSGRQDDLDAVADAFLLASKGLVAIAVRSLDGLDDETTLPQFRSMVVLRDSGGLNLSQLAAQMGVQVSSAMRLCNRLERRGLVTRTRQGREVTAALTPDGGALVDRVMAHRRDMVRAAAQGMTPAQRRSSVAALQAFANAVGEVGPGQL